MKKEGIAGDTLSKNANTSWTIKPKKRKSKKRRGNVFGKLSKIRSKLWKNHKSNFTSYKETAKYAGLIWKEYHRVPSIKDIDLIYRKDIGGDVIKNIPPISPDSYLLEPVSYFDLDNRMNDFVSLNIDLYIHSILSDIPSFNVKNYNYDNSFKGYVDVVNGEDISGDYPEIEFKLVYSEGNSHWYVDICESKETSTFAGESRLIDAKIESELKNTEKEESKGGSYYEERQNKIKEHKQLQDYYNDMYERLTAQKKQLFEDITKYRDLGMKESMEKSMEEASEIRSKVSEVKREINKLAKINL